MTFNRLSIKWMNWATSRQQNDFADLFSNNSSDLVVYVSEANDALFRRVTFNLMKILIGMQFLPLLSESLFGTDRFIGRALGMCIYTSLTSILFLGIALQIVAVEDFLRRTNKPKTHLASWKLSVLRWLDVWPLLGALLGLGGFLVVYHVVNI